MYDFFNDMAANICDDCSNGDEICFGGSGICPWWYEFQILRELCFNAEQLAGSIDKAAHNDFVGDY